MNLCTYEIYGYFIGSNYWAYVSACKRTLYAPTTYAPTQLPPTDAILMPLTRAWGAEGFDEAVWGEAESKPEAGARVQRGLSQKTTPCFVKVVGLAHELS